MTAIGFLRFYLLVCIAWGHLWFSPTLPPAVFPTTWNWCFLGSANYLKGYIYITVHWIEFKSWSRFVIPSFAYSAATVFVFFFFKLRFSSDCFVKTLAWPFYQKWAYYSSNVPYFLLLRKFFDLPYFSAVDIAAISQGKTLLLFLRVVGTWWLRTWGGRGRGDW